MLLGKLLKSVSKNYRKIPVKGISFDKKGKLLIGLLRIFNTKIGTVSLAILLKILKTSFPKLIIYDEDELPSPDIKWIINNFEKI